MARIDRLEEAPKRTLQLASVIGREFTRRLLDRIADIRDRTEEFLQELKAIELIYEKSVFPELAYMFKHALTHEVAYNSLLVQRRKELHRLIALAIEELYADRLAEQYEVLAYHFARGEEWAKALEYLLKAAEKAAQAFATREAIALYDQALEAAGQLGDAVDTKTLMAIHQAKAHLYFVLSDFERSRAEGERLLTLARQAGDRVSEGSSPGRDGLCLARGPTTSTGRSPMRARPLRSPREVDAKPVLAGGLLHHRHDPHRSQAGSTRRRRRSTGRSRSAGQVATSSTSRSRSLRAGQLKNWGGEYAEASRLQSEALQIAREHNLLVPLLDRSLPLRAGPDRQGRLRRRPSPCSRRAWRSPRRWATRFSTTASSTASGGSTSNSGTWTAPSTSTDRAPRGPASGAIHETIANAELNLGDIFLAQGDLALAQEFLDGVYRLVHDPATSEWMKWRYSMHLFASLGELWLARGEPAKAQEFAEQCLEIATRTNSRKYLVKGWRLMGEIALARRQWDEAERALQQALTIAQAIGNPTQLWKTHLALWSSLHSDQEARDGSTGLWRCPRCYRARQGQSARSRAAR